jgi:hypothetical protein
MSESGVFLRESVLDIPQVENLYGTPRAFNFYMSRKSGEEWEEEQKKDGNGKSPVNIPSIENGVNMHSPDKMAVFESGKADYRKISDIDLCTELDSLARNVYGRHSVYHLTKEENIRIATELSCGRHLDRAQIQRCLVML